jgi:hypothetical protein
VPDGPHECPRRKMQMSSQKRTIRRYLVATLVGMVIGLVGLMIRYESFLHMSVAQLNYELRVSLLLNDLREDYQGSDRTEGEAACALLHQLNFLHFLLDDNSASNILLSSTLLVAFAVYTFDVVAAPRQRRRQGIA